MACAAGIERRSHIPPPGGMARRWPARAAAAARGAADSCGVLVKRRCHKHAAAHRGESMDDSGGRRSCRHSCGGVMMCSSTTIDTASSVLTRTSTIPSQARASSCILASRSATSVRPSSVMYSRRILTLSPRSRCSAADRSFRARPSQYGGSAGSLLRQPTWRQKVFRLSGIRARSCSAAASQVSLALCSCSTPASMARLMAALSPFISPSCPLVHKYLTLFYSKSQCKPLTNSDFFVIFFRRLAMLLSPSLWGL